MTKYLKYQNLDPVKIRPVRYSDVGAWLNCLSRNFPDRDFTSELFWDRDTWGAFDGDRIVGCVSLWGNELQWLASDEKYRRVGLSWRLVSRALQYAEDHRDDAVVVKLNPETKADASLFRMHEFEEITEYEFLKTGTFRNPSEADVDGEAVPA